MTVDAAAPGKREADERSRAEVEVASGISGGKIQSDAKGGGIGRSVGGFIDPSLNWNDLAWLRSRTKLPIGLKGIQTVEVSCRRVWNIALFFNVCGQGAWLQEQSLIWYSCLLLLWLWIKGCEKSVRPGS